MKFQAFLMNRGYFITFEGGDGSGKSTQINILKQNLIDMGYDVLVTREPGGTSISEQIRKILLDSGNAEMNDITEMMLYAASRAQLVNQVIVPALDEGKIVICDRFVDSSIAYQAYGRKLGDMVGEVNNLAVCDCMPDMTFFLRVDPVEGSRRIGDREKDRIELASTEFHERVYMGYREIEKKNPERIKGIDANATVEEISETISEAVKKLIAR